MDRIPKPVLVIGAVVILLVAVGLLVRFVPGMPSGNSATYDTGLEPETRGILKGTDQYSLPGGRQGAPTTIPTQPVGCTQEAMLCPDGSAVGRTGPNCSFAPCPQ